MEWEGEDDEENFGLRRENVEDEKEAGAVGNEFSSKPIKAIIKGALLAILAAGRRGTV